MKRKISGKLQSGVSKQNSSSEENFVFNEQIESKMRILANCLIDRVLKQVKTNDLKSVSKNGILIMEHNNLSVSY